MKCYPSFFLWALPVCLLYLNWVSSLHGKEYLTLDSRNVGLFFLANAKDIQADYHGIARHYSTEYLRARMDDFEALDRMEAMNLPRLAEPYEGITHLLLDYETEPSIFSYDATSEIFSLNLDYMTFGVSAGSRTVSRFGAIFVNSLALRNLELERDTARQFLRNIPRSYEIPVRVYGEVSGFYATKGDLYQEESGRIRVLKEDPVRIEEAGRLSEWTGPGGMVVRTSDLHRYVTEVTMKRVELYLPRGVLRLTFVPEAEDEPEVEAELDRTQYFPLAKQRALKEELGRPIGQKEPSVQAGLKERQEYGQYLYEALMAGDYAIARQALDEGANPNWNRDPNGPGNPLAVLMLSEAAPLPQITEMVELLLQYGANPRMQRDYVNKAVVKQRHEIVKLLIRAGAKISHHSFGDTPLHDAASAGDMEMVHILLAAGADPTVRQKITGSATPAELARKNGHTEIGLLLDGKAEDGPSEYERVLDETKDSLFGGSKSSRERREEAKAEAARWAVRLAFEPGIRYEEAPSSMTLPESTFSQGSWGAGGGTPSGESQGNGTTGSASRYTAPESMVLEATQAIQAASDIKKVVDQDASRLEKAMGIADAIADAYGLRDLPPAMPHSEWKAQQAQLLETAREIGETLAADIPEPPQAEGAYFLQEGHWVAIPMAETKNKRSLSQLMRSEVSVHFAGSPSGVSIPEAQPVIAYRGEVEEPVLSRMLRKGGARVVELGKISTTGVVAYAWVRPQDRLAASLAIVDGNFAILAPTEPIPAGEYVLSIDDGIYYDFRIVP